MNTLRFGAILALVAATTFGCSGDDDDSTSGNAAGAPNAGAPSDGDAAGSDGGGGAPAVAPLEIIGEYDNDFMGTETITTDAWNNAAIVAYDNDANVVYTQNPDDADFNASKFVKTVYTQPETDGSFYFCMVVFDADTLADAQASEAMADDSDPALGGCGGTFPWTKATKK
jgi:hypothetical protein